MANMKGLLQSPMFLTGASLLANNTGHYGAFGPALGTGILNASQLMGNNADQQIKNRYMQALTLQALQPPAPPKKTTSEYERIVDEITYLEQNDPTNPKLQRLKDRAAKLTSTDGGYQLTVGPDGTVSFGKGNLTPTQTGNKIEEVASLRDAIREGEELQGQVQYLGSPLFSESRRNAAGVLGGIGDAIGTNTFLHDAAEFVSPKELEAFKSKSIIWVGGLREPILKERGKFSDQDQRILDTATGVLRSATSKLQMDTAIGAVNEMLAGRLDVAEKRLGLPPWKGGGNNQGNRPA